MCSALYSISRVPVKLRVLTKCTCSRRLEHEHQKVASAFALLTPLAGIRLKLVAQPADRSAVSFESWEVTCCRVEPVAWPGFGASP